MTFAAGQKVTATALTNAIPLMVSAVGDGLGNHTTTSATFAVVHASMYNCAISAVAGDKLKMVFSAQLFHSTSTKLCQIKFSVAGTTIAAMPTEGLALAVPDANRQYHTFEWVYTVQSGDISSGTVTVRPMFATDAATLTIRNLTANGLPLMTVLNMRQ